jgi:hypothetical protein
MVIALIFAIFPFGFWDFPSFLKSLVCIFAVSVVCRYPAQISVNFRRRSTQGWSMELIYCEIAAIFFFVSQITIDGYAEGKILLKKLFREFYCEISRY